MTRNVFANLWEIAAKSGMNKSVARFPDVCLSPPSPPAGPIPVPYPDTSFSTDLKAGSKTVKIGGKPAALAQQSYYKASLLGDETATRSFGANVITHQITGKTYFQAWSMDVKFEGKNVCRHFDLTTSNHASVPGGTPPLQALEIVTTKEESDKLIEDGKCPCCKEPLHPWQRKDDGGTPAKLKEPPEALDTISEDDFWESSVEFHRLKFDRELHGGADATHLAKMEQNYWEAKAQKLEMDGLKAKNPGCPNVHPAKDVGCGVYFKVPKNEEVTISIQGRDVSRTRSRHATVAFQNDNLGRQKILNDWAKENPSFDTTKGRNNQLNHKTPKSAGGCNSARNVVPDFVLEQDPSATIDNTACARIEELQGKLESRALTRPRGI